MHALDRPWRDCGAIVIDPNPTSRSILAAQLRDLGIGQVTQSSRVQDGRRQLESREFEFVLCEQSFPNEAHSGQDLLDDLRRAQLLPFTTVFVMITAEATYDKVAEAAESALDGYLLKPHTAVALAQRLRHARERKRALRDIFEAIEAGEFEAAARACLRRFQDRGAYWLYAARLGAELLLRLERHESAHKLYEAVTAAHALPWARLGIARAQLATRQTGAARKTLEELLSRDPQYADAYDVMGRVQLEQGHLAEALHTYRQASELTPGSLTRLQKRGMLAFYLGDHEEAAKSLEKAAATGIHSKLFDPQSLVLLAFTRFQQRDSKGLQRCAETLATLASAGGDAMDVRLQRFSAIASVLVALLAKQVAAVIDALRTLAAEITAPGFDVEAACNLLALLGLVSRSELQLDAAVEWVDGMGWRFGASRALAELLASAASSHPPFAQRIRDRHADLQKLAENCLAHTLEGDPATSVRKLLDHARRTCSAKLVETAARTLQRHESRIDQVEAFKDEVASLQARYGQDVAPLPLVQDGVRESGSLALRV